MVALRDNDRSRRERQSQKGEWCQKERLGPGFLEHLGFNHNPFDTKCLEIGCHWVSD